MFHWLEGGLHGGADLAYLIRYLITNHKTTPSLQLPLIARARLVCCFVCLRVKFNLQALDILNVKFKVLNVRSVLMFVQIDRFGFLQAP